MAYNQNNLLDRVEKVQEIWRKHNLDERSNEWIYKNHIKEEFNISIKTFYNWLNINVTKKRRELEEKAGPNNQLSLWDVGSGE